MESTVNTSLATDQKQKSTDGKIILLLLCVILAGSTLRLYKLDYQSLWYDELHSVIPTAPQNTAKSIIEYCKMDQPPAYFLYLHYMFKVLPYEESAARFASALLGIISIVVLFFLGREFGDNKTGLVAALLVAVNYFHIFYSQEARFYSMAFLFSALSYFFIVRVYKHTRIIDFMGYIICTVILLYTHYFGLIIFAAQCVTFTGLVALYRRDRRFIVMSLVSGIIVLVCFIPWMPVIISDLGISSFWIKKPTPYFILDYFYNYFGKDAIVTILFVFLIALFVRTIVKRDQPQSHRKPLYFMLILWLLLSYLIPYVKSLVGVPLLHIRYTIITLPAWIIIFAIGWDTIKNAKLKYVLVGCIILSSVLNLIFIRKHYSKIQKQQFREVSQLVLSKNISGDPVYSDFSWHYNFYFRDSRLKVDPAQTMDTLKVDKFWLLTAQFFYPQELETAIKKYEETFKVAEKHSFYKTEAVFMVRRKTNTE